MSEIIKDHLTWLEDRVHCGPHLEALNALRNVVALCDFAYGDPRTMGWYIKRGIARELGLNEDEVEFLMTVDPAHLTDAELAAWVGHGLHPEKAGRLIEEVRRLRTRLAHVETNLRERIGLAREEADRLGARLAKVEAVCEEHGAYGQVETARVLAAARGEGDRG